MEEDAVVQWQDDGALKLEIPGNGAHLTSPFPDHLRPRSLDSSICAICGICAIIHPCVAWRIHMLHDSFILVHSTCTLLQRSIVSASNDMWTSGVIDGCVISIWMSCVIDGFVISHVDESCHIWMHHVTHGCIMTHTKDTELTYYRPCSPLPHTIVSTSHHIYMSHVTYECIMSNINESCRIWMSHVAYECIVWHMKTIE